MAGVAEFARIRSSVFGKSPAATELGSLGRGGVKMLGLERGVLRIVPYCEEWTEFYRQESQRIRQAIGAYICDIQHIGSTAVLEMSTKPIIDIAVAGDCLNEAEVCIRPLEDLCYEY